MDNKLYVGNLPYSASEESLTDMFSQYGTVGSVRIVTDRDTGRSKGFGFVEMSNAAEAQDAIAKLNGFDLGGRQMNISIAKPMEKRPQRSFGGGRR